METNQRFINGGSKRKRRWQVREQIDIRNGLAGKRRDARLGAVRKGQGMKVFVGSTIILYNRKVYIVVIFMLYYG